ncbi:jacalin-related lectin 3-like [Macadamia integrifolia]|uniref:jacalin-related lectin 3-like n=1 Tax=Macadamia integrifolia TaxID=60698 RepID=UPI001C53407A|nr:jacalin-related lectin 3-like [Macadamia integrifolia]
MSSWDGYEKSQNQKILVGPWGGQDGSRWDDGVYSGVRQVVIRHGSAIDSIQIEYDARGCSIWSDRHGGTGGCQTDKIKLDFPQEFLTSISGYYGSLTQWGPIIVRSLSFESNRKKHGPFGTQEGTQFTFPITCGKIIGFHGRCSCYLGSIGVYLKPLQQQNPPRAPIQSPNIVGYTVTQETIQTYGVVLAGREKGEHRKVMHTNQFFTDGHGEDELNLKVQIPYHIEKESSNARWPVRCGPWGGDGGTIFDDGVYTGVREVHIMRNGGIVSIKACYDRNGQEFWGNRNGGKAGLRLDKMVFDYPSEILTHISGYYGSTILMGPTVVKSLTFHTTKRKYGPFGDEQGISFNSGSKQGRIVGFHGCKGWFVDSIGVHVLEANLLMIPRPPICSNSFNMNDLNTEVRYDMVKGTTTPAALGPYCGEGVGKPWGGDGGQAWDDGAFSGVKQIYLIKGDAICSIQIEYDRNGQPIWSARHGGGGGYSAHKIRFDYPHEVVARISGYYGPNPGDACAKVIRSLTFFTNRARYGPYGEEIGTFFSSSTEGRVVGFHGRSGCYLDAIGVHMQHTSADQGRVKAVFNKMFN